MLLGTIVNAVMVLIGSAIGLSVRALTRGKKLGDNGNRIFDAIFIGLGLAIILIGIGGAIKGAVNDQIISAFPEGTVKFSEIYGERTLAIILSIVIGVVIGEIFDIDKLLNRLGDKLQSMMKGKGGNISEGFVSASLLFCVGSMAIVGSMDSGISGDHTVLITKGVLDLIAAIIFSVTMGVGVAFSAVAVFLYQGAITLMSAWLGPFLSGDVINCMSSVGSLLIIALGFNLVCKTKIKILNFIPSMFLPIAIVPLLDLIK